jgi:hypothetical protein
LFFIDDLPYKLGQIGKVEKFICPGRGNITLAIFIDDIWAAVSGSIDLSNKATQRQARRLSHKSFWRSPIDLSNNSCGVGILPAKEGSFWRSPINLSKILVGWAFCPPKQRPQHRMLRLHKQSKA